LNSKTEKLKSVSTQGENVVLYRNLAVHIVRYDQITTHTLVLNSQHKKENTITFH